MRRGEHGVRSAKQAIAIGLSKARRAGVDLPPPEPGEASPSVIRKAKRDVEKGKTSAHAPVSEKRSRAITRALKKEGTEGAGHEAMSRQVKAQARKRTPKERSESAKQGAKTRLAHQSRKERQAIARKAARTRKARQKGS